MESVSASPCPPRIIIPSTSRACSTRSITSPAGALPGMPSPRARKTRGRSGGTAEWWSTKPREARAQEHLQVARALWDSVEPDAIVLDRESGVFADPQKVHVLDFRGRYYNVRGTLPASRHPQGRPVIIQAVQSGPGMELAATYADLQFSTRRTLPSMEEHRAALDAKLSKAGRTP